MSEQEIDDEAMPAISPEDSAGDRPLAPGLYVVGTPIGNLEDITLRALRVLRSVDKIACEDTRLTQKLLNHFAIKKPLVSYHLHNEQSRAAELVTALQDGARIAVVSDAGMPGIADPGEALVHAAITAGIKVFPIPGANAALSALVASGLSTEHFAFGGFLPSKSGQRRTSLEGVQQEMMNGATSTHIFYETPHRILEALADVAAVFGPAQRVVVARELTKLHEEFLRGTAAELLSNLKARDVIRGEMVVLLESSKQSGGLAVQGPAGQLTLSEEVMAAVREGLSQKDALKRVAKARGLGKSEAYREWQRSRGSKR